MSKSVPTVHIDNEHVPVTEWVFAPDATTGWHRHDFDYVITPAQDSLSVAALSDQEKGGGFAPWSCIARHACHAETG